MVRFLRGAVPVMLGIALSAWCVPEGEAIAQQPSGTVSPARKAQAQQRFAKAKTLYKQGKYRAAVEELEEARKLDPEAPDLVYNLGVVHEKLVEIDKAIEYYKLFVTLTDNADEIARVQGIIQRLEGAKTEVAPVASAAPSASSAPEPAPTPPPAAPKPPEKNGRFDGLVIASGVVAVAGLATGIVFGIKAKGDEVTGTPKTDPSTSYQDLEDRNDSAKKNALFADIGFGVAIVGGVTGALLYFARSAEPSKEESPSPSAGSHKSVATRWTPSVALLPGGGAMAGIGGGF